jgi:hypothetical protein
MLATMFTSLESNSCSLSLWANFEENEMKSLCSLRCFASEDRSSPSIINSALYCLARAMKGGERISSSLHGGRSICFGVRVAVAVLPL